MLKTHEWRVDITPLHWLEESESRAKWITLGRLCVKMRILQELESLYNPTTAMMEVNISVMQTVIAITK